MHVQSSLVRGKAGSDPVRFLPALPAQRSKPSWQQNTPNFVLFPQQDTSSNGTEKVDLVAELTASKNVLTFDWHCN